MPALQAVGQGGEGAGGARCVRQRRREVVGDDHLTRGVVEDHLHVEPVAGGDPAGRPDLVEDFLTNLSGHGFTDQQVADAYRAFSSFLLGHLLLESAARGADTAPVEEPFDEGDAQIPQRDGRRDLTDTPTTTRLKPLLSEDRSDEEFEVGLETLLDRLEMVLSQ